MLTDGGDQMENYLVGACCRRSNQVDLRHVDRIYFEVDAVALGDLVFPSMKIQNQVHLVEFQGATDLQVLISKMKSRNLSKA